MSLYATKKKLQLDHAEVHVRARFRSQGSALAGTARGTCEGFDVEVHLESPEPEEEIETLLRVAHQMCFTEDALTRPVAVRKAHFLNGRPLEAAGQQG